MICFKDIEHIGSPCCIQLILQKHQEKLLSPRGGFMRALASLLESPAPVSSHSLRMSNLLPQPITLNQCLQRVSNGTGLVSIQFQKVINLPAADITRYKFYTKIRRKMPPLSSTMVGPALSGKPIQPTTHPPRANATSMASNDNQQSISKHCFNTYSNFGIYTKLGTGSYVETCTKAPPPKVITQ